jgi:hypothetical protein
LSIYIYILKRESMSNMVLGTIKKPLIEYKVRISRYLIGGIGMNEVEVLHGAEPREILQTVTEKKAPAIMSYLSRGEQRIVRVLLTNLGANRLDIQVLPGKGDSISRKAHKMGAKKPHPIDIQVNQPVSISLKYGYGRFTFETTVAGFEPSSEPASGGEAPPYGNPTIALMIPDRIEITQRRSYLRVEVPSFLKVNVMLWHRRYINGEPETQQMASQTTGAHRMPPEHYWRGRLTDISTGGARIVVDAMQRPDFKKGQFIRLTFTPMPYEMPLTFDARIRGILLTADEKSICLGLQIVGLEENPQTRQVLHRLCSVVEAYYRINQYSAKQRDFQTTS